MEYLPHQVEKGRKAFDILKRLGYVYIAGKPRSGKTATAIYAAEQSTKATRWLVLCPKQAISGWTKMLNGLDTKHSYYVTNYEQLGRVKKKRVHLRLNPKDFDGVILDESHNYGVLGRPSQRILVLQAFMGDKVHIHLSGTAIIESPNSIYHQTSFGTWRPFHHSNFYTFHKEYGIPYFVKAQGRNINQYDRCDFEKLKPIIDRFTVYMTQEDAGIDIQAEDIEHYVTLDPSTVKLLRELQEHLIVTIDDKELVADSIMKLRTSLHMIEGGVAKIEDDYIDLPNTEKIDYIKKTFGDSKDIGIMCHFVGERDKLKKHFKQASIYSSTSHAEGVDLSHLKHFIIYSSGYSGAKFVQRRERIININGSASTKVHHILVKGWISEAVYKTTSRKQDFNNETYISIYG